MCVLKKTRPYCGESFRAPGPNPAHLPSIDIFEDNAAIVVHVVEKWHGLSPVIAASIVLVVEILHSGSSTQVHKHTWRQAPQADTDGGTLGGPIALKAIMIVLFVEHEKVH